MPSLETNGVNGTHSPNEAPEVSLKPVSKSNGISITLKELEVILQRLLPQTQDLSSFDELVERNRTLEAELEAKTREVSTYQASLDTLVASHEQRYLTWESSSKISKSAYSDLEQRQRDAEERSSFLEREMKTMSKTYVDKGELSRTHDRQIQILQEKHRKEITFLQQKLTRAESTSQKLKKELSDKSRLLVGTERQLESCLEKLEETEKEFNLEELDIKSYANEINNLAGVLHELAKDYFFTPLPDDPTKEYRDLWSKLQQSGLISAVSVNIPISNSVASKQIRMAAVEHIIATHLCTNIFQPLYSAKSGDTPLMEEVMNEIYASSPRKEAVVRSCILDTIPDTVRYQSELSVVNNTTAEVIQIVKPLLGPQELDSFQIRLVAFFTRAVELWRPVQRSTLKVVASTEYGGKQWDIYEDYDASIALSAEQNVHRPLTPSFSMALFPQVYFYSEPPIPIHNGYALFSDQNIAVAAYIEFKDYAMIREARNGLQSDKNGSNSALSRSGSLRHTRKTSISASSEQLQTSPKTPSPTKITPTKLSPSKGSPSKMPIMRRGTFSERTHGRVSVRIREGREIDLSSMLASANPIYKEQGMVH